MRFAKLFLPILGGVFLTTSAVYGQTVLFNDLSDTVSTYYPAGPIYESFSTGSTAAQLTQVQVVLGLEDSPSGTFTFALYADSSATPGGLIQTIATEPDSYIATQGGTYTFSVSPTIALTANTRYWIGLTGSDSEAEWANTNSNSGSGVSGQYTCFLYQLVVNHPSPNLRSHLIEDGCYQNVVDPFLMSVTATTQAVASAPALSFGGMLALSLMLAASAALLLRRSAPSQS